MTQAGRTSAAVQAVTSWHTPSQYGFEFPGDPVIGHASCPVLVIRDQASASVPPLQVPVLTE
jgi:hypothetical protein